MDKRANEVGNRNIRFSGSDIILATKMIEKLSGTIDILYYLMNRGAEHSFVMILISANNIDVGALLEREKRDTDILFEIDREASLYTLICQGTKVDGGYHFAERILKGMQADNAEDIYCTDLEIRSTKYDIKILIFKLIETYMKSKHDGQVNEIVFKSLN